MNTVRPKTLSGIISDFLASEPTLEQLAEYRLPDDLQQRAHALLDMNRQGTLTTADRAEMEDFRRMDQLLTLTKAKARLRIERKKSE
jgi:hypothetical protein